MERMAVSSTNIASVGYDEGSQTLEIEFVSGQVYEYYDVPASVYAEFLGAGSLGSYHHANIRGVYRYQRI